KRRLRQRCGLHVLHSDKRLVMCTRVTSVRAQFPGTDDLSVAVGHPELVHQAGLADPFLPARQDRTHTLFQSTSGVGGQEGELVVAPDEDRIGRDGPGREGGWILQGNSMSLLRGFPHRDVQAYACFLFRVFFSVRKGVSCPEASWGGTRPRGGAVFRQLRATGRGRRPRSG